MQCCYNMVNYLNNPHQNTSHSSPVRVRYRFIFCLSNCGDVYNIMLYWTIVAFYQHLTALLGHFMYSYWRKNKILFYYIILIYCKIHQSEARCLAFYQISPACPFFGQEILSAWNNDISICQFALLNMFGKDCLSSAFSALRLNNYGDIVERKHLLHYWLFVWRIHWIIFTNNW